MQDELPARLGNGQKGGEGSIEHTTVILFPRGPIAPCCAVAARARAVKSLGALRR